MFKYKLLMAAKLVTIMALLGWIVMLLWNWIVPHLFAGGAHLDYWRALGLLVLCRILVGGFGRHHHEGGAQRWQRWQAMTPEERAQFRAAHKGRFWGHGGDWTKENNQE
nr:hypothetical protein [uncultured Duganella sp.]